MQGIFLHGSRPQTKKVLKEVIEAIPVIQTASEREAQQPPTAPAIGNNRDDSPDGSQAPVSSSEDIIRNVRVHKHDGYCVVLEATSAFGNEYDGSLENAPKASTFTVVGPDPRTARKWYATIQFNPSTARWEVK